MGNDLDALLCIVTSANYNKKLFEIKTFFSTDILTKDKLRLWKLKTLELEVKEGLQKEPVFLSLLFWVKKYISHTKMNTQNFLWP